LGGDIQMKLSTRLFIPIFVVLFTQLFAQTENESSKPGFKLKVSGGLNYSSLTHENTISLFGPFDKPITNFSGGISAVYSPSYNYNFEVGFRHSKAGAKTEEQTGTDETGKELGKFWFVRELQFIEVPILFIYQFNAKNIVPSIFIGPNIGFLIDGEEKLDSDYGEKPWNSNIKEKVNTINLSTELGIGLKYLLNDKIALGISAFYLYGLTNQVKDDAEGEQKTRDFRVFSSLYYSLR
jgi:hypothetical protein